MTQEVINHYDEMIEVKTEFFNRTYHAVDASVLKRFKLVFGKALEAMFQEANDKIPLDSELTPKEISGNIILKMNGKYIQMSASQFVSFNVLKWG